MKMYKLRDFPHRLVADLLLQKPKYKKEDVYFLISEFLKYKESALTLEREYISLYQEKEILRNQNEFLLRLVGEEDRT